MQGTTGELSLRPTRVLFIGNSYTFYHQMPKTVCRLMASKDFGVHYVARGGIDLRLHWLRSAARKEIQQGNYSHVVIQERSTGPLHASLRFYWYALRFVKLAQRHGARALLYQTWPRAKGHEAYQSKWSGGSPDAMLEALTDKYATIAQHTEATVVPVGQVWGNWIRTHSDDLYDADGHHASALGAYLSACTFCHVLGGNLESTSYQPEDVSPEQGQRIRQHVISYFAD